MTSGSSAVVYKCLRPEVSAHSWWA